MFIVITLIVVGAMGYLLWIDRINVIKEMKADIAKVVEAAKNEGSAVATAVMENLKKHL